MKLDIVCVQEINSDHKMNTGSYEYLGPVGKLVAGFLVQKSLLDRVEFLKTESRPRASWLKVSVDGGSFFLASIHNHNASETDKQQDLLMFVSTMVTKLSGHGSIVVCGDFNARVGKKYGGGEDFSDTAGKRLVLFCDTFSLIPLNVGVGKDEWYTREQGLSRSIIDYVMVEEGVKAEVGRVRHDGSDHYLLWLKLEEMMFSRSQKKTNLKTEFVFSQKRAVIYQKRLADLKSVVYDNIRLVVRQLKIEKWS